MELRRTISVQARDDGLNAWERARMSAAPALEGSIDGYADYRQRTGGFTTRRELPHAGGVLIFNLGAPIAITGGDGRVLRLGPGEAFVAGAHLRPALSHSGGAQAGVHVHLPLATLRRLLGVPMSELVDRTVALEALLGAEARDVGARLAECRDREARAAVLDEALAHLLARAAPLDVRQRRGLAALRARPDLDVAEIAREVGWSCKHFRERIQDAVGVGPRCYRRLLRFQSLTAAIAQAGAQAGAAPGAAPGWAELALDAGYCDQAHMIREFREFSGLTPGSYLARRLPDGGLVEA